MKSIKINKVHPCLINFITGEQMKESKNLLVIYSIIGSTISSFR